MMVRKLARILALLLLLAPAALAEDAPLLRGYDEATRKYEYATFGVYPYGENGEEAPVLWRVLGWGVPAEDDVISRSNYPKRDEKKYANKDELRARMDAEPSGNGLEKVLAVINQYAMPEK